MKRRTRLESENRFSHGSSWPPRHLDQAAANQKQKDWFLSCLLLNPLHPQHLLPPTALPLLRVLLLHSHNHLMVSATTFLTTSYIIFFTIFVIFFTTFFFHFFTAPYEKYSMLEFLTYYSTYWSAVIIHFKYLIVTFPSFSHTLFIYLASNPPPPTSSLQSFLPLFLVTTIPRGVSRSWRPLKNLLRSWSVRPQSLHE